VSELTADALAAGFPPRPALNLRFFGGRTIAHLVFANHYLGGAAAWVPADVASIDAALAKAMTDNDLQSVIQQYYDVPISSRMLPSVVLPGSAPATIYKDQVEAVVARICPVRRPRRRRHRQHGDQHPAASRRRPSGRLHGRVPAAAGPGSRARTSPASPSPAACGTAWLPARHRRVA
jgi:hypothetical protein